MNERREEKILLIANKIRGKETTCIWKEKIKRMKNELGRLSKGLKSRVCNLSGSGYCKFKFLINL